MFNIQVITYECQKGCNCCQAEMPTFEASGFIDVPMVKVVDSDLVDVKHINMERTALNLLAPV